LAEQDFKARSNHLHELLVHGDPAATALIAEEILPEVMSQLRHRKEARGCDEQVLFDAIYDAFFEYTNKPDHFQATKSSLLAFLTLAAHRNLLNTRRSTKTRLKYEESVEVVPAAGNSSLEENNADDRDEQRWLLSLVPGNSLDEKIASLLADPVDQRICKLMLQGERSTAEFIKTAGLTGDVKKLAAEIKRRKDRITKALERAGARLRHGKQQKTDT
jgi:DNA-directed RNA polymerase specialized sigma24 family protein